MAKPRGLTQFNAAEFRVVPPHPPGEYPANFALQGPRKWKRICELIYSRVETPYQTESDVLRAAIDYGLEHMAAAIDADIITGMMHELQMMARVAVEAKEQNDFVDYLDALQREVERACDRDMRESAVGWVWAYRERARKLPDRIVGRRVVSEINRRFGYLLRGAQGRKAGERMALTLGAHEHGGESGEELEEVTTQ
jgi:hypothetical protein